MARWIIVVNVAVLATMVILLANCVGNQVSSQPTSTTLTPTGQFSEDVTQKPSPTKEGTLSIPTKKETPSSSQVETVVRPDNALNAQKKPANSEWDVVVLGQIDACWVCQFEPPPHVTYTRVLSGEVPSGQTKNQLALVEVDKSLLPKDGTPIYKSKQEEIVFLKKVTVPGYEDENVYKVVAVMEATAKNLATFPDH